MTEPIDLAGLHKSENREVRLFLGGGTIWVEDTQPVTVHIEIEADLPVELPTELPAEAPEETLPLPGGEQESEQEIG